MSGVTEWKPNARRLGKRILLLIPSARALVARLLATRALEDGVRGLVGELLEARGGDREVVGNAIRTRFEGGATRRRAALKVLARRS